MPYAYELKHHTMPRDAMCLPLKVWFMASHVTKMATLIPDRARIQNGSNAKRLKAATLPWEFAQACGVE
jgi:hypothetical protein